MTSGSSSAAAPALTPYPYVPQGTGASSSGNAVGAITGSSGASGVAAPTGSAANGTFASPSASASASAVPVPYTGAAAESDAKLFTCFFVGVVAAVLLI